MAMCTPGQWQFEHLVNDNLNTWSMAIWTPGQWQFEHLVDGNLNFWSMAVWNTWPMTMRHTWLMAMWTSDQWHREHLANSNVKNLANGIAIFCHYVVSIISTFLLLIFFSEISMQNSTKLGWDGHCSDRLALCPGLPLLLNIEISLNGQTSA